jgi:hypothetical protein
VAGIFSIFTGGSGRMATEQRELLVNRTNNWRENGAARDEPPIGVLFKQLSEDASRLVRQEVALGKVELKEVVSALGRDAARIGIAAGVAIMGAFAALAFIIIGLGDLLGNYWLSALITAVVLLAIGAVMVKSAMADIKRRDLKPTATIETLRDDAQWAKREIAGVKRDWKS